MANTSSCVLPEYCGAPLTAAEVIAQCCMLIDPQFVVVKKDADKIWVQQTTAGVQGLDCKVTYEFHLGEWINRGTPAAPIMEFDTWQTRTGSGIQMFDCIPANKNYTIVMVVKIGECADVAPTPTSTGCALCGYFNSPSTHMSTTASGTCCYKMVDLCNCNEECLLPNLCIGGRCVENREFTCTEPGKSGQVLAACAPGSGVPCSTSPAVNWSYPAQTVTLQWSDIIAADRFLTTEELAQEYVCNLAKEQAANEERLAKEAAQASADALCQLNPVITVINDESKGTYTLNLSPADYVKTVVSPTTTTYTLKAPCPTTSLCVTADGKSAPIPYKSTINSNLGTGVGNANGSTGPNQNCGLIDGNKTVTITYDEATNVIRVNKICNFATFELTGPPGAILAGSDPATGVYVVKENTVFTLVVTTQPYYETPIISSVLGMSATGSLTFNSGSVDATIDIADCASTDVTLTVTNCADGNDFAISGATPVSSSTLGNTTTYVFHKGVDVTVTATPEAGYSVSASGYPVTQKVFQFDMDVNRSITFNCNPIPVYTLTVINNCTGSTCTIGGDSPLGFSTVGNVQTYQYYANSAVTITYNNVNRRQTTRLYEGVVEVSNSFNITADRTLTLECAALPRIYFQEGNNPECGQPTIILTPSQPIVTGVVGPDTYYEVLPETTVTFQPNLQGCCRLGTYGGANGAEVVTNQIDIHTQDKYVEVNYIPDTYDLTIDNNGCAVAVDIESNGNIVLPYTTMGTMSTYRVCKNVIAKVFADGSALNVHPVITGAAVGTTNGNPAAITNDATVLMNGPKTIELNQAGCTTAQTYTLTVENACTGSSTQFNVTGGAMATMAGAPATSQPSPSIIEYQVTNGATVSFTQVGLAGCGQYEFSQDFAAPVPFAGSTSIVIGGDTYVKLDCVTCKAPSVLTINNNCPGSTITATPDRFSNTSGSPLYYDDNTSVTLSVTTLPGYNAPTITGDFVGGFPANVTMDRNKTLNVVCTPYPKVRIKSNGACCANWDVVFSGGQYPTGKAGGTPVSGGFVEFANLTPGTTFTVVPNPSALCSADNYSLSGQVSQLPTPNTFQVQTTGSGDVVINCLQDKKILTIDNVDCCDTATVVLSGGGSPTLLSVTPSGSGCIREYAIPNNDTVTVSYSSASTHHELVSGTTQGVNNGRPSTTNNSIVLANFTADRTLTVNCYDSNTNQITVVDNCDGSTITPMVSMDGIMRRLTSPVSPLAVTPGGPQTVVYEITTGATVTFTITKASYGGGNCSNYSVLRSSIGTPSTITGSTSFVVSTTETVTFDCTLCEQPKVLTLVRNCKDCSNAPINATVTKVGAFGNVVATGSNTWNVTEGAEVLISVSATVVCPAGNILIDSTPALSTSFIMTADRSVNIDCPECPCNGDSRRLTFLDNCGIGSINVVASPGSFAQQVSALEWRVGNNSEVNVFYSAVPGRATPTFDTPNPIVISNDKQIVVSSCPCNVIPAIAEITYCGLITNGVTVSASGNPFNCSNGGCTTCPVAHDGSNQFALTPGNYVVNLPSPLPNGVSVSVEISVNGGPWVATNSFTVSPSQVIPIEIRLVCMASPISGIASISPCSGTPSFTTTFNRAADLNGPALTVTQASGTFSLSPGTWTVSYTAPAGYDVTQSINRTGLVGGSGNTVIIPVGASAPSSGVSVVYSCVRKTANVRFLSDPECDGGPGEPTASIRITSPSVGIDITVPGTYAYGADIALPTNATYTITKSGATFSVLDPSLASVTSFTVTDADSLLPTKVFTVSCDAAPVIIGINWEANECGVHGANASIQVMVNGNPVTVNYNQSTLQVPAGSTVTVSPLGSGVVTTTLSNGSNGNLMVVGTNPSITVNCVDRPVLSISNNCLSDLRINGVLISASGSQTLPFVPGSYVITFSSGTVNFTSGAGSGPVLSGSSITLTAGATNSIAVSNCPGSLSFSCGTCPTGTSITYTQVGNPLITGTLNCGGASSPALPAGEYTFAAATVPSGYTLTVPSNVNVNGANQNVVGVCTPTTVTLTLTNDCGCSYTAQAQTGAGVDYGPIITIGANSGPQAITVPYGGRVEFDDNCNATFTGNNGFTVS